MTPNPMIASSTIDANINGISKLYCALMIRKPSPFFRPDHFGSHQQQQRYRAAQAQPDEDGRGRRRENHSLEDLGSRRAENARHLD